jgi:hypothetical protein
MSNISYTINKQTIDQVMLDLRNLQGKPVDLIFEDSGLINKKDVNLIIQSINRYKIDANLFGSEKAVELFASMGYTATPIKKFRLLNNSNELTIEDSLSYKLEEDTENKKKHEEKKGKPSQRVADDLSKIESKSPKKRKALRGRDVVKIMLSVVFVTASLILLSVFLLIPSAQIEAVVSSKETNQGIEFRISKNITTVDELRKIIPAEVVTKEFEKSQEFETQGRRLEGTKASGVVVFYNERGATQPLLPRTRLRMEGTDLIFRTDAPVRIPGGTPENPGTAEVGVTPDDPGEATNAKAGQSFTVVNLSGFLQERVYAKAKEDFSGGSTNEIPRIGQGEIDEAKNALVDALISESLNEMRESDKDKSYIISNNSWWTEAKEVSTSHGAGEEVDKFSVSAKVEVSVLTFSKNHLSVLISSIFGENIKEGQRLARQKYSGLEIKDMDQFKGEASVRGQVNLLIENEIDLEEIKRKIAGKTKLEAEDIFKKEVPNLQHIDSFGISPGWSSNMPILTSRIDIVINEAEPEIS